MNMDTEVNELKAKDIPRSYPLCFNGDCAERENCLHYKAGLLKAEGRCCGVAVFPTAWEGGTCKCFRENKMARMAWGFSKLYDNVPKYKKAVARQAVRSYFSNGMGPYYRVHHGQSMLSPRQQSDILEIVSRFGSIEGIEFDHYVAAWDFD